jgi:hypothetical protein
MALKRQIESLQNDLKDHTEILEHLCSLPEPEALTILRHLRTSNASMVLSSVRGSSQTRTPKSNMSPSRGVLPPTKFGIEFELTTLHKSVYPALVSLDIDSVDIDGVTSSNPGRSPSSVPSKPYFSIDSPIGSGEFVSPNLTIADPSPLRGTRLRSISALVGPIQDHLYCDSRLNSLKIDYWTRIPISDELAARVISHYLETYHPIFGCFDADLFLTDLVSRNLDYCSPFLLSALMSFACVG